MIEAGRGAVINLASGRAIQGAKMGIHYAASKAGIIAMTKTLGQACLNQGDEQSLQTAATQSGTHTLAHNALQRITQGSTSWQEALRHVTLEAAQ